MTCKKPVDTEMKPYQDSQYVAVVYFEHPFEHDAAGPVESQKRRVFDTEEAAENWIEEVQDRDES